MSKPQRIAISRRTPAVDVEYDGDDGHRKVEHFPDCQGARRFYMKKLKAGKHPTIKKPQQ